MSGNTPCHKTRPLLCQSLATSTGNCKLGHNHTQCPHYGNKILTSWLMISQMNVQPDIHTHASTQRLSACGASCFSGGWCVCFDKSWACRVGSGCRPHNSTTAQPGTPEPSSWPSCSCPAATCKLVCMVQEPNKTRDQPTARQDVAVMAWVGY